MPIMRSIETEIFIEAPIEIVWRAFIDFDQYQKWNPFLKIQGSPVVGEKLLIEIEVNGKLSKFKPKVVAFEENRHLEWKGSFLNRRVFGGHHYFQFKPVSEYQTHFVHGENFSGILRRPILNKIGEETKKGFIKMNESLKEYAEGLVI